MDDLAKLVDLGTNAILIVGFIGLWRSHERLMTFVQALLSDALDRQETDRQAERQRKKLGRAVGIDLDEDTQGKRPAGFDAELAARRSKLN